MERKRFSVLFFIKRSKLLKNGEAPVRVRVTYDRLYVELQLKRSVKVPLWSQDKEKSIGKDRNSVELNHYIDALRVKFYQIYQDLELEGKIISARAIVNRYQGKDETFKTLYNVFKEHNDNCRKLIGTDYADITVRRYDNCLKYLMELVKRDYKVDDILLREVNGELVRNFDLYLKTEKHCAQNTVIRYMKCFKKVINLAIANEWITKNPFAGIKFHEVEVNKQFLSQTEINKIWQKEFKIERLELVRDVFIFRVYTGLAFIDVYNLRPEHISEDSNGNLYCGNGTNFNNVSEEALEALVKYRVEYLNISIDGATQETYSIYRVGGNLCNVLQNIERLNNYKERYNSEYPKLSWQFVIFGHNEQDLPKVKELCLKYNMAFNPKLNYSQFSPVKDKEFVRRESGLGVADRDEYRLKHNHEYKAPCYHCFSSPQINWNGDILGCSVNKWRSLGNVKDGSLTQWTESEGFKALVELLFEGRDTSIDLPCKHCPNLVKVLSCPLSIEGLQKYNEYIAPALR